MIAFGSVGVGDFAAELAAVAVLRGQIGETQSAPLQHRVGPVGVAIDTLDVRFGREYRFDADRVKRGRQQLLGPPGVLTERPVQIQQDSVVFRHVRASVLRS